MRRFDNVSARVNFLPKYCSAVSEKAVRYLVFVILDIDIP